MPSSLSHSVVMPAFLCLCYQHQTVDCKKVAKFLPMRSCAHDLHDIDGFGMWRILRPTFSRDGWVVWCVSEVRGLKPGPESEHCCRLGTTCQAVSFRKSRIASLQASWCAFQGRRTFFAFRGGVCSMTTEQKLHSLGVMSFVAFRVEGIFNAPKANSQFA
jgi:hypothetical protein